jgi:FKBP-type peptidyl-prolyl cis-trans isomerase
MRNKWLLVVWTALAVAGCSKQEKSAEKAVDAATGVAALDTDDKRASYSLGVNLGMRLKQQQVVINVDSFTRGFTDATSDKKRLLTDEQVATELQNFEKRRAEAAEKATKGLADKNKAESAAFLAENAKKDGVKTTASGLQYKIVKAGKGPMPKSSDEVQVHYAGKLVNGTEFDSSIKRGEPVTFPVNGVIAGWTEALQLMPEGSTWEVYIPSDLAYGPGGTGDVIGPNAALVFEVQLLKVNKAAKAK